MPRTACELRCDVTIDWQTIINLMQHGAIRGIRGQALTYLLNFVLQSFCLYVGHCTKDGCLQKRPKTELVFRLVATTNHFVKPIAHAKLFSKPKLFKTTYYLTYKLSTQSLSKTI